MPLYPLEVLMEAERRQSAAMAANALERERAVARTLRVYRLRRTQRMKEAYRMIGTAMDLAASNIYCGRTRKTVALLLFERQWKRERQCLRQNGLRLSRYDATEQFVRCIRLWRAAGVLTANGVVEI